MKNVSKINTREAGRNFKKMQFKLFTIPVSDSGAALEELNRFLRGHKTLAVDKHLIASEDSANWCFCVSYIANALPPDEKTNQKKDYKNLLSLEVFEVFSKLRKIRKELAEQEAVPAYAIFTDEELAGIAGLEELTISNLQKVSGIGIKKTEKYGALLVTKYLNIPNDETGG